MTITEPTETPIDAHGITTAAGGESSIRPDGIPKVLGSFEFSSDLSADGMVWGRTLRSPHPRRASFRSTSVRRSPSPACTP